MNGMLLNKLLAGRCAGLLIGLLALAACEPIDAPLYATYQQPVGQPARQVVNISVPFNESDFTWSAVPGKSTISGQAFIALPNGEVKSCAGGQAVLIPHNAYTMDIRRIGLSGAMPNRDPRYMQYRKIRLCDSSGHFKFENLPAGTWRLSVDVAWYEPARGLVPQGSALDQVITTSGTDNKEVVLTEANMITR